MLGLLILIITKRQLSQIVIANLLFQLCAYVVKVVFEFL